MNKIYLVTFDTGAAGFDPNRFHQYFVSLFPGVVKDWWHYFHHTYIVISDRDANQLYNLIYPGIPGRFVLVVELQAKNAQGWLPAEAWRWLQKYIVVT